MAEFDPKKVHKNDWGVIGGGAAVLIASFLPWFSLNLPDILGSSYDASRNGLNSGFLSWFAVLCAVAAAGIVGARIMGVVLPKFQFGERTIVLALAGVAALFILLKLLLGFHGWDRGIGLILAVIGAVVQAFFAYTAFAASGERADIDRMRADRAAKAAATAATTATPGAVPPPPAGFAPPPPPAAAAAPHDHDGDDHSGHDHPHPH